MNMGGFSNDAALYFCLIRVKFTGINKLVIAYEYVPNQNNKRLCR